MESKIEKIGNVLYKKKNHICTITINRPEKLNIVDTQTMTDLTQALKVAQEDLEVRCVVLTGEGNRIFTAGGDIKQEVQLRGESARAFSEKGKACMEAIYRHRVPVICAVKASALGVGMEFIVSSDISVLSETAQVGIPTIKLAAIPAWGCAQILPKAVGLSRAKELMYTGRSMDAEEALRLGLVEFVVTADQVMEKAMELAEGIAKMAPIAMESLKISLNASVDHSPKDGSELDTQLFIDCHNTEDKVEGMSAFLEKRDAGEYHRR